MHKELARMVQLPCCGRFRRYFMRRKSAERTELSCCMSFDPTDDFLCPEEWIDMARKASVRAIVIAGFQGEMFETTAHAVEKLRWESEPEPLDFKVLYGMETVLEDGQFVHLLVQRQEGLAQLYHLLELAWQGREDRPFLRKEEIIIKIFALSSPLDLRGDDWETLVQNGTVPFSEIIGSQDDIFCHLLDAGLDCGFAYRIAEDVSRGRGLDEEITAVLMENGIQEWFIHSCSEIVALWPKAVVAETKVIPAIRAVWYKAHFSEEYAQVYFEVYAQ